MQSPAVTLPDDANLLVPNVMRRKRRSRQWLRLLSPLALLALWQIACQAGWVSNRTLAPPSQVISAFADLAASGALQRHFFVSLIRVCQGVSIALVLGTTLALIAGLSRSGEYVIDAPMQMLRTLPILALIPFFIIWFGIGEAPKVALIAVAATFPIYLTLYAGIRGVDPKLIEVAKVIGLSRSALVRHVILPGALPTALVGLRYALGIAWLYLVVAEQVNATSGIGFLMNDARDFLRIDILVVGLLIYAFLGLLIDLLVRVLEWRLLAWRSTSLNGAA